MTQEVEYTEAEILAAIELRDRMQCENDLYWFLQQCWPVIEGGKTFSGGWAVRAMCEHLEEVYYGRALRLLVNIPPRSTKSTLISVVFPVWCWIKDPSMQLMTVSYAEKFAKRDNVKSRRLIKSDWFQARWGDKFALSEDQDTKNRVDNMQGGYRVAVGLDSGITGEGANCIIIDDPNSASDLSEAALDNALSVFTEVLPTRFNDLKTGRMVVVQQRVHEKDISGWILANQKSEWARLILPMEYEADRHCTTIPLKSTKGEPWTDPRTEDGELLMPERVGPVELRRLKSSMSSQYAVAGQLQQRPAPQEGGLIKRGWFKPWKDTHTPRTKFVIQAWDTGFVSNKNSSYSAMTTWGVFEDDHGYDSLILLAAWRAKMEFPELYKALQRMSRDYAASTADRQVNEIRKPDLVMVEEKASGIPLVQTLNKAGSLFLPWRPDKYGDKVERVRKVTHLLESGRVYIPMRAPDFKHPRFYAELLVNQAAAFPNAESRDMVDTMTMVLQRVINSGWVLHPVEHNAMMQESFEREMTGSEAVALY